MPIPWRCKFSLHQKKKKKNGQEAFHLVEAALTMPVGTSQIIICHLEEEATVGWGAIMANFPSKHLAIKRLS
jgi:hypothetical protein